MLSGTRFLGRNRSEAAVFFLVRNMLASAILSLDNLADYVIYARFTW